MSLHFADNRNKDAPWKQKEIKIPKNKIQHNMKSTDSTVNKKGKFKVLTEPECHKVMSVLRQTNTAASKLTLKERMLQKKIARNQKLFTNENYFKKSLEKEKNKNSLRNRIKLMRKQKIFPQPVGPTNYKKQFGMLKKIVIK